MEKTKNFTHNVKSASDFSDMVTRIKQAESASSCIDIYANILKNKLVDMGKLKDESDLLVEFKNDYDMIYLLLSHITDKSDEIIEVFKDCKQ